MSMHENEVILDYSVKDLFGIFIKVAKRDFPNFKEKTAVGTKVEKKVGAYSGKTATMTVEITDFEKDKVYEITSTSPNGQVYTSRYEFEELEENKTKISLSETEASGGIFAIINSFIVKYLFKKRINRRFEYFVKGLEAEAKDLIERRENSGRRKNEDDGGEDEVEEIASEAEQ